MLCCLRLGVLIFWALPFGALLNFFLLLLDQLLIVFLLFKTAFEILEILRWSYICCVVVWVFASLTIFCRLYLLAVWILSCCDLMIIFGILCHRFVTPPFLISPGFRLPCLVPLHGGLGLRGAHRASSAAFLGCCISSFALCSQLLSAYSGSSISISSIPGKELAISCLSALLSGTPIMEVPASQFSEAQRLYQFQLDTCQSSSLLSSCSLRDQARIRAISSHPCASAWLRAIPSVSLGLTISRQEFVCSLWYWLGIPVFASTDSIRCSCGIVVDRFGDHLLGCGHGPMRIRRHDALCDIVFHALLQDNSGCKREQRCGSGLDRPGDVYHPDFLYGKPAYFDVTLRNPLQGSLLS